MTFHENATESPRGQKTPSRLVLVCWTPLDTAPARQAFSISMRDCYRQAREQGWALAFDEAMDLILEALTQPCPHPGRVLLARAGPSPMVIDLPVQQAQLPWVSVGWPEEHDDLFALVELLGGLAVRDASTTRVTRRWPDSALRVDEIEIVEDDGGDEEGWVVL